MTSRETQKENLKGKTELSRDKLEPGLIHYYFGDGKGKTSSLFGATIRALGNNLKPIIIQFLKLNSGDDENGSYFMGEIDFLNKFIPIYQFGSGKFINPHGKPSILNRKLIQKGFEFTKETILKGEYDFVGLDEIINAISLNLIDLDELTSLLEKKPEHVEVVCTGFMYYSKLKNISDYVVSFSSINHPYDQGIEARKGIEY
jgi:cob(I)alamin adenosyltransferase